MEITEPFAGYTNFADCVSKNKDKSSPEGYCAAIQQKTEGIKPMIREKLKWNVLFEAKHVKERSKTERYVISGDAIHETTTRNNFTYTAEELSKSAHTLIGKPLLKDHEAKIDNIVGLVNDAYYNQNSKSIKFEADVMDQKTKEMIDDGRIQNVSIGASVEEILEDSKNKGAYIVKGLTFDELSLVAIPGDPNAGITQGGLISVAEALDSIRTKENMTTASLGPFPNAASTTNSITTQFIPNYTGTITYIPFTKTKEVIEMSQDNNQSLDLNAFKDELKAAATAAVKEAVASLKPTKEDSTQSCVDAKVAGGMSQTEAETACGMMDSKQTPALTPEAFRLMIREEISKSNPGKGAVVAGAPASNTTGILGKFTYEKLASGKYFIKENNGKDGVSLFVVDSLDDLRSG